MSKMTKRWLSIVTTLAVAFTMCFGCMGEVFATGEQVEEGQVDEGTVLEEQATVTEEVAQEESAELKTQDAALITVVDSQGNTKLELFLRVANGEGVNAENDYELYYNNGGVDVSIKNEVSKTNSINYSGLKNTGSPKFVKNAYGPLVKDVLAAAGYDEMSNISKITVFPPDNSNIATISGKALTEERYSFPKIDKKGYINMGLPATSDEIEAAVEVKPIINLSKGEEENTCLIYGQTSPSDRNKPSFIDNLAKIQVTEGSAEKWDDVKLAVINYKSTPNEGAKDPNERIDTATKVRVLGTTDSVEQGSYLGFVDSNNNIIDRSFTNGAIYYTTDGTTPDVTSTLYNWCFYESNPPMKAINPIAVTDAEKNITVKTVVTGYAKGEDSNGVEYNLTVKKGLINNAAVSVPSCTYNGGVQTPAVTVVSQAGKKLVQNTDYTASYAAGRKNVGTYSVTVAAAGSSDCVGSKTVYFNVNPKGATIKTPARGKTYVKVKWARQKSKMSTKRITGYQVQLAKNSSFTSGVKTYKVKGYKKTSKKISKLSRKTTYYVKVRTYMGNYYSNWSAVRVVKTK